LCVCVCVCVCLCMCVCDECVCVCVCVWWVCVAYVAAYTSISHLCVAGCWSYSLYIYIFLYTSLNSCKRDTAYCIWSVISSIASLNRFSSSLGLFCHVPLKRDQGDWDWRLRLRWNDTPNVQLAVYIPISILESEMYAQIFVKMTPLIKGMCSAETHLSRLNKKRHRWVSQLQRLQKRDMYTRLFSHVHTSLCRDDTTHQKNVF